MADVFGPAVALGLVLALGLIVANRSIRVVGQGQRMVVFRLGQAKPEYVRGPGLQFVLPIIRMTKMVDVREQAADVSSDVLTKDEVRGTVDLRIRWRIVDAFRSVVDVTDFATALQGVATTTVRSIVGDIAAVDMPFRRAEIGELLRAELDRVAERWGGQLTTLEIAEVNLRHDVRETMDRPDAGLKTPEQILAEVVRTSQPTSGAGH